MRLTRRHAFLTLCVAFAPRLLAQNEERPPDGPYEFVSGAIADLPPGKIVVNRAVLGKPAENHTFTITGETRIEGQLRVAARVTVGYRNVEGADPVAVRIIVRPDREGKR